MKKLLFILFLSSFFAEAQQIITPISNADYEQLKAKGKLDPAVRYKIQSESTVPDAFSSKVIQPVPTPDSSGACSCMQPLDATYTIAPFTNGVAPSYRNDDGSTNAISIPFNFCFYNTNYSSVYINNNGNITFQTGSPVFSSTGFPNNTDIMIAPFWSDVDTRDPGSGLVHYKVTPTYMIIKWEAVGYYSMHVDKLCTFQLIITDGNDPILPGGKNIAFCYGNMDWTTGDASSGVNGFGGTPATVGVNKGNGTNFIQIGRFDAPGTAYIGPYANNQVDWLDNKSFFFDGCGSSTNLPPISTTNSACGDTITICAYSDTLVLNSIFLAPENNQNITITASAPTLGSNFSVLNNTGGVTGQLDFMVIGSTALAGYHTITITATDNGTPALSTTVSYVVNIVNNPIADPVITVSPTPACASSNPTVTLTNCSTYDSYIWSNGNTNCSFNTTTPGQYFVTVSKNGCYKTSFANTIIYPAPAPIITGSLSYCNSQGTTLYVVPDTADAAPYTNIVWNPGGQTNDTISGVLAGTYTVTVTDTIGCTGSTTVNVTTANPTVTISSSPSNLCPGDTTTLTASIPGGTYTWSPSLGTGQSIQASTPGVYSVTVSINGCTAQNSFNLTTAPNPTVTVNGTMAFCQGSNTTLTATSLPSGSYSYAWSTGSTGSSAIVSSSGPVTVIASNNATGCVDTNVVNITVHPNPTLGLAAQNNNVICAGDTNVVTATASGGTGPYVYNWTPNIGTTSTGNAVNAGTYSVTVTDQNNCSGTSNITLTLSTPTISVTGSDTTICPQQCESLYASGSTGLTFAWSPSITSTNDTVQVCQPAAYTVTGTDANGCTASAVINVFSNPVPVADFDFTPPPPSQPGVPIFFFDSSTVNPGNIVSWDWEFGDGDTSVLQNTVHTYSQGGTFPVSLIVTTAEGCKDTIIKFYSIDVQIYAPNIITPNNDGKNDYLYFKGLEFYANNKLIIFNRWGEKIFEQANYTNSWNGKDQNDGTYYYILEVPDGKPNSIYTSYFLITR
jgi:gliding motility-associated-like protein